MEQYRNPIQFSTENKIDQSTLSISRLFNHILHLEKELIQTKIKLRRLENEVDQIRSK